MNISPARLERPSSPARALRPQAPKPYSPAPSLTILKTEPRGGVFHSLESLWLKVKTFFFNLVTQWFGRKSATASPTTGPEVSAKAALTADQPLPLPKEIEVVSGLISLPDKLVVVKKLKINLQESARDINRLLSRIEDYAQPQGSLQTLRITSFYEKDKALEDIGQLKAEIDRVNADLKTKNNPKVILKLLSTILKSLQAVAKKIGKRKELPVPVPKTAKETMRPIPPLPLPARMIEALPPEIEIERVEVTTIVETLPSPAGIERARFDKSIVGKQAERIAAKLNNSFPRLINSFKEAVFQLFRQRTMNLETSLVKLEDQIGDLAKRKIERNELFGTLHEIIRLGGMAGNREGREQLTGIGQNLGEITFYLPEIKELANGRFYVNGGRRKAVQSLDADGYCRKSGTLIEIKYCSNLQWFITGEISKEEEDVIFRIVSQFRKCRKALEDGIIRAVEFHFTASSLHPAAMQVLKETFQQQINRVKIYLYPSQAASEGKLIFNGADITAIKQVA